MTTKKTLKVRIAALEDENAILRRRYENTMRIAHNCGKKVEELDAALARRADEVNAAVKLATELRQSSRKSGECNGCSYNGNYRKCTSCARYPKLQDKYISSEE